MLILSETIPAQPDYVALAMVAALLVLVAVMTLRKYLKNKRAAQVEVPAVVEQVPAEAVSGPNAPGSAGQLKLHNVPPKTAAMLMAIVADKTGKPLNELRFISIKEVQ